MNRSKKHAFIVAGFLFIFLLLSVIYAVTRPVRISALSLVTLDGQPVRLDSMLAGKRTVLNFWATWCKPCIAELPQLDSLSQMLDDEAWQIVLVSDEPLTVQRTFRDGHPLHCTYLGLTTEFSRVGIAALPRTIIVDGDREVLYSKTGGFLMSAHTLQKKFTKLRGLQH